MGWNKYGQLGDGTTTDRSTPVQVMASSGVAATDVIAVAADYSCSLYVTSDGKLWTMGDDCYGGLLVATGLVTESPTFVITFDAQSGSVSPTTKTVQQNSTYGTLPTPTRNNYDFGGWWTGANGTGQQITAATTVTTAANQTLYAKWTANTPGTYALTLNSATATPSGPYVAGATVTITANSAPSGQVFDKWTSTNASVTFASASATTTTFTMPASAATVTATYKDKPSSGGGGGAPSLWMLGAIAVLLALRRMTNKET